MSLQTNIRLVINDIRSTQNVGSLLRTTEGLGVQKVYFCGYTPYPVVSGDTRLPHISKKLTNQIHKTALGAESSIAFEHAADIAALLTALKADGFVIAALEQSAASVPLHTYAPPDKIALLLGREVEGLEDSLLKASDVHLEIPMFGKKESYNVAVAAGMALYQLRFN